MEFLNLNQNLGLEPPEAPSYGAADVALAVWASGNRISPDTLQILLENGYSCLEERTDVNELEITLHVQKKLLLKVIEALQPKSKRNLPSPSPRCDPGRADAQEGSTMQLQDSSGIPQSSILINPNGLDSIQAP